MTCVLLLLTTACATFPGKKLSSTTTTTRTHSKTGTTITTRTTPDLPREIIRPEQVHYASVQSPKRQASTQLVTEGKQFLEQKNYDQARRKFEEAVGIDTTNGAAYYYLAVINYDLKDYPKALGFLDQAESLFNASPEWTETIQKFREIIRTASGQ